MAKGVSGESSHSPDISPDNEQFLQQAIAAGVFIDRRDALDQAIGLLRQREEQIRTIDEGTRQLRSGECKDCDSTTLRELFDRIQVEGRLRFDSRRYAS